MNTEKFLSTEEAAKYLGCTGMTLRRYLHQRKIEYLKFGRNFRIPFSSLIRFKNRCRVPAKQEMKK